DVLAIFMDRYLNIASPIGITEMTFIQNASGVDAKVSFQRHGRTVTMASKGNGSLDAVSNALREFTGRQFNLKVYTEHSVQEKGSGSTAAAYIGL
uniref:alpha-isopropylmalate synthase regulatory domain-containing protein n=1 Tax=Klebsiella pneumoniae TaxID=573 RepID=UPI0025A084ED